MARYQGPDPPTFYRYGMGPNMKATAATLAALGVNPDDDALAALALTLAASLDDNPGAQLANQAREHRQCLTRLARQGPGDDTLAEIMAELSRPVTT